MMTLRSAAILVLLLISHSVFGNSNILQKIATIEVDSEENLRWLLSKVEDANEEVAYKAMLRLASLYSQSGNIKNASTYLQKATDIAVRLGPEQQFESLIAWKTFESQRSALTQTQENTEDVPLAKQDFIVFAVLVLIFGVVLYVVWQQRRFKRLKLSLYEQAMQQKQRLSSEVTHGLRTPLTALKLQIEALQHNLIDDVQIGYDKLQNKANEINRLITDIYKLTYAEKPNVELFKQEVDIKNLFEKWNGAWENMVTSAGFEWQSQLDIEHGSMSLDADKIKQVIDHLIYNSIQYTRPPNTVLLNVSFAQRQLTVSVQDSAATVPEDKLDKYIRLHQLSVSDTPTSLGPGVGLATYLILIIQHGGTISGSPSKMGGIKIEFSIEG